MPDVQVDCRIYTQTQGKNTAGDNSKCAPPIGIINPTGYTGSVFDSKSRAKTLGADECDKGNLREHSVG